MVQGLVAPSDYQKKKGEVLVDLGRVSPEDFESDTWIGNRNNLVTWCSIGGDAEYGKFAILGARQGAYMTMFDDDWDYTDVRDFNKLDRLWTRCLEYNESDSERFAKVLRKRLKIRLLKLPLD